MAGVDVGSSGGKRRNVSSEVNMIPLIDLLMVTVAFLLITAVWTQSARLESNAEVPGQELCRDDCGDTEKVLHVHVEEQSFRLVWRHGRTVMSERTIPKVSTGDEAAPTRYPELADALRVDWETHGQHRDPSDRRQDRAVIHTADAAPYRELVGVLDAVAHNQRELTAGDEHLRVAVYNPVFSTR